MHHWIKSSLLLLYMSVSHAATQEPIYLKAGSASINQTTHIGRYHHQVTLDQGPLHLNAFSAETKTNEKNQLIFAIAKGAKDNQAHIWTTAKQPPLHAYADKIIYYPLKHSIELIGHARIIQGDNSFSAPKIVYNTLTQHIVTESLLQERTVIIYKPAKTIDEHFIR